VQKGLVVRETSETDRRQLVLRATAEGLRKAESGLTLVRALRNRTFSDVLGHDDVEALIRILGTFVRNPDLVAEFGPRSATALQLWLGE
jgi:DNA-binding MarR family transcriptional regulator